VDKAIGLLADYAQKAYKEGYARGLDENDHIKCPECGSMVVTNMYTLERFKYGLGADEVELCSSIPVRKCAKCGFQWTDHEAESVMEAEVRKHLEDKKNTESSKRFILLEGLDQGNRFTTTNTPGEDHTKLYDGTVAYKILGYADTIEEAQGKLYTKEEWPQVVKDYVRETMAKIGMKDEGVAKVLRALAEMEDQSRR